MRKEDGGGCRAEGIAGPARQTLALQQVILQRAGYFLMTREKGGEGRRVEAGGAKG